jgi:hypothetical protein
LQFSGYAFSDNDHDPSITVYLMQIMSQDHRHSQWFFVSPLPGTQLTKVLMKLMVISQRKPIKSMDKPATIL